MRTMRTAVMVCATMVLVAARPLVAAPQALGQAPADVDAFVLVPNLAELSAKLADVREAMNLPMPEMNDALGAFKQASGMTAGIDDNAPLLAVLPDLGEAIQAKREPTILLLIPVTDYDAFVNGLGGQAGEQVTSLTLRGAKESFSRHVGRFALLGESRRMVEAYQPGNAGDAIAGSVGALGRQYLDELDALLYVNLARLAPTLLPLVEQSLDQSKQQFDQMAQMGMMSPAAAEQVKVMYDLYASAARTFLNDSTGYVVGLELGDAGIGLVEAVGYKADSTLAQVFPNREARATALTSLPEQPFIFAMAMDLQAVALAPLYEQVAAAMPAGEGAVMPAPELWLPMIRDLEGLAMAFYAPDDMAMMSGNVMNTLTVLDVKDADSYVANLKKYVTGLDGLEVPIAAPMAPPGPAPGQGQGQGQGQNQAQATITYHTTYTDNALQLDGAQVDQFQVRTNMPPQMMQQMGPAAGFAQMFMNYSGYIAGRNDKVLATTVIDPQLVTRGFAAMDKSDGIGSAGVVNEVRDAGLPPDPVAEAYISISGIAQAANIFMGMFGAPPIEAPADLPPIAMGLSTQDNSLAFKAYLPLKTGRFIVDTVNRFAAPGGPGGAQPGPGAPPPF